MWFGVTRTIFIFIVTTFRSSEITGFVAVVSTTKTKNHFQCRSPFQTESILTELKSTLKSPTHITYISSPSCRTTLFVTAAQTRRDDNSNRSKIYESALSMNSEDEVGKPQDDGIVPTAPLASEDMDEEDDLNPTNFSYFHLALFAATVCGRWFVQPVQSLVDTVAVGRKSTCQMAALGPATIVFDAAIYCCYFLATATTNLLSTAIAKKDEKEQQKIISQGTGIAVLLGIITVSIIYGFGENIFVWMVGKNNPQIVSDALIYSKIRVLNAPVSVAEMVFQATCFSYLDTLTPTLASLVALAINLLGDFLLCIVGDYGIRGAAAATAFAEFVSCAILFKRTRTKFHSLQQNNCDSSPGKKATKAGKKQKQISFISVPKKSSFQRFLKIGGPVIFLILGELSCQFILTLRAAECGMLNLAAHNIILRVFLFFATFGDGINHAAQTFMPRVLHYKPDPNDKSKSLGDLSQPAPGVISAKQLFRRLGIVSGAFCCFCSILSFLALYTMGPIFTSDATIINLLKRSAPWVGAIFLIEPFNLLFEGTSIAKHDFKFLLSQYCISLAVLAASMHSGCSSLIAIWRAFFGFQVVRFVQFVFRPYYWKTPHKRSNPKAA